jgi:hypothetical protein
MMPVGVVSALTLTVVHTKHRLLSPWVLLVSLLVHVLT